VTHPASYSTLSAARYQGLKGLRGEYGHSPLSGSEIKNEWMLHYTSVSAPTPTPFTPMTSARSLYCCSTVFESKISKQNSLHPDQFKALPHNLFFKYPLYYCPPDQGRRTFFFGRMSNCYFGLVRGCTCKNRNNSIPNRLKYCVICIVYR